jgi:hypothetical protein
MKLNFIQIASVFVLSTGFLACGDSQFKGETGKRPAVVQPHVTPPVVNPPVLPPTQPLPPDTHLVNVPCLNGSSSTGVTTSLVGGVNDKIKIQGEMCPSSFSKLSVVFAVDESGSMNTNDPSLFSLSCGRLSAIKTIVNKLKSYARPGDDIQLGLVMFSASANVEISMRTLTQFESSLSSFKVCGSDGGTNYQAALSTAQSMLTATTGPRALYFITDGEPQVNSTSGGQDTAAQQDGLNAANSLRSSVPGLIFNAIFLQKQAPTNGFNAQQYLGQITGAPDRVRLASNADQMATEIATLALPVIEVLESSAQGLVTSITNATGQPVQLESFAKHPSRPGVYVFTTVPFQPYAIAGQEVVNQVVVKAMDRENKPQTVTTTINYKAN